MADWGKYIERVESLVGHLKARGRFSPHVARYEAAAKAAIARRVEGVAKAALDGLEAEVAAGRAAIERAREVGQRVRRSTAPPHRVIPTMSVRIGTGPSGVEWVSYRQGRGLGEWQGEIDLMRKTLAEAGGKIDPRIALPGMAIERPFIGPPAPPSLTPKIDLARSIEEMYAQGRSVDEVAQALLARGVSPAEVELAYPSLAGVMEVYALRQMGPIERMARQGGPTPQIPAGTMFDPRTGKPLMGPPAPPLGGNWEPRFGGQASARFSAWEARVYPMPRGGYGWDLVPPGGQGGTGPMGRATTIEEAKAAAAEAARVTSTGRVVGGPSAPAVVAPRAPAVPAPRPHVYGEGLKPQPGQIRIRGEWYWPEDAERMFGPNWQMLSTYPPKK